MDYDGDGRLAKLVKNGVTEYRFYDGAQCYLRTDAGGTALDWTVWGPTPDEVIARSVSGAWQFYHQDQINSVYAVTNAAGTVLERYLYDPFGLPDVRDASWGARTSTAIGNPWLFTGQEWRGDLGLSNYKARWYQPTLGRFMQNDPVRFDAGDINLYRYCGNDPVNRADPLGLADVNLISPSDSAFKGAELIPSKGEVFTVVVHGAKDGGFYADARGETPIKTKEVIKAIKEGGHKEGQPIQAAICYGASKANLRAMKEIAKAANAPVVAATKAVAPLVGSKSGEFKGLVVEDESGKGAWVQVNPDGKVSKEVTVKGVIGEPEKPKPTTDSMPAPKEESR